MKDALAKQPGACHELKTIMKKGLVLCSVLWGTASLAQPTVSTNDLQSTLSRARVAELPLISALLVNQAAAQNRIATTREVVRYAARWHPATTVPVVGAIGRSRPAVAATAAAAAVEAQPALAGSIVQAAVAVAPQCAGEIVTVVCGVAPSQYHEIALAAASAAPVASREILRNVGQVRTELKPYIEVELAKFPDSIPPVARCLRNAERAQGRAGTGSGDVGGHPGPSKRPKPGPPAQSDKPPRGDENPPGGRNYARP